MRDDIPMKKAKKLPAIPGQSAMEKLIAKVVKKQVAAEVEKIRVSQALSTLLDKEQSINDMHPVGSSAHSVFAPKGTDRDFTVPKHWLKKVKDSWFTSVMNSKIIGGLITIVYESLMFAITYFDNLFAFIAVFRNLDKAAQKARDDRDPKNNMLRIVCAVVGAVALTAISFYLFPGINLALLSYMKIGLVKLFPALAPLLQSLGMAVDSLGLHKALVLSTPITGLVGGYLFAKHGARLYNVIKYGDTNPSKHFVTKEILAKYEKRGIASHYVEAAADLINAKRHAATFFKGLLHNPFRHTEYEFWNTQLEYLLGVEPEKVGIMFDKYLDTLVDNFDSNNLGVRYAQVQHVQSKLILDTIANDVQELREIKAISSAFFR